MITVRTFNIRAAPHEGNGSAQEEEEDEATTMGILDTCQSQSKRGENKQTNTEFIFFQSFRCHHGIRRWVRTSRVSG